MNGDRRMLMLVAGLLVPSVGLNVVQYQARLSQQATGRPAPEVLIRNAERHEMDAIDRLMTSLAWRGLEDEFRREGADPIDPDDYSAFCRYFESDGSWHVLIRQRRDPGVTHKVWDREFIVKIEPSITEVAGYDHPPNSKRPLPDILKHWAAFFQGRPPIPVQSKAAPW